MSRFVKLLKKRSARRSVTRRRRPARFVSGFEPMEPRLMLAVTASFMPAAQTLMIMGDAANNTIEVSRNAAGTILVNGGAVAIQGGRRRSPTPPWSRALAWGGTTPFR